MTTPLEVQTSLTKSFIDASPVEITLIPRQKQSNGSGGWRLVDLPARDPQVVTLVPQDRYVGQGQPVETEDGEVMKIDFVIIAMPGAQIAKHDYWEDGDFRYEVRYIMLDLGYEVRAGVTRYGP